MVFTGSSSTAAPARPNRAADDQSYFNRWLKIWIVLLVVVVLVVVAYLVAITSALSSINGGLKRANTAVTGAGGNVVTLPDQISTANTNLAAIDKALKAIPDQADAISGALGSIDSKLATIDPSLKDTSGMLVTINGSLVNTEGSLKNTSGMLVSVLGLARNIDTTLEAAENPDPNNPFGLGAHDIFERVAIANIPLNAAQNDTKNIVDQLSRLGAGSVVGHLTSICNSGVLQLLGGGNVPC